GKSVQEQWSPQELDEFKGWTLDTSNKGWTNDEIAVKWLKDVFIPETALNDPNDARLLILDGHGSHITDDFIARKNALSTQNIKCGWRGSGLWPICIAKPLTSPLLLKKSNRKRPEKTTQSSGSQDKAFTPVEAPLANKVLWSTPKRSIDLERQIRHFHQLGQSDPTTQDQLFKKIEKGYNGKYYLSVNAELQIHP
ncbi:hypothetical protein PG989_005748, partial [Apiospora arundinis]